jgi:hypothetical protein
MSAKKSLFQTALTDLETSDVEGLGVLREKSNGDVYRWVKNASGTALIAGGCCLMDFTTTKADIFKRVRSPNVPQTGPSTCLITMPAGSPETGIAASGANTGDHGWIKVAGIKKVSMRQSATAALQQPGCCAIATGICVTNSEWGKPYTGVINSTVGGVVNLRCVQIVSALATTGVATVASAIVQLRCL